MAKISKITAQQRRGRYNVYLDGKYAFPVAESVLVKFRLMKGQELTKEQFEQHSPGPAHRLGDEEVRARQDCRVELDKLHIRQHCPGASGREDPGTRAHPTAGGAGEDPAVPAGGDDGRIRTEV